MNSCVLEGKVLPVARKSMFCCWTWSTIFAMPKNSCAVKGCHYSSEKLKQVLDRECFDHKPLARKNCSCEPPYALHQLPKDDTLKRQWKAAVNVKNPPLDKHFFVCSYHFVDREPSEHQPVPQLFLGYPKKVNYRRKRNTKLTNSDNSGKRFQPWTCYSLIVLPQFICDSDGP